LFQTKKKAHNLTFTSLFVYFAFKPFSGSEVLLLEITLAKEAPLGAPGRNKKAVGRQSPVPREGLSLAQRRAGEPRLKRLLRLRKAASAVGVALKTLFQAALRLWRR
jgi:hypothetical protein